MSVIAHNISALNTYKALGVATSWANKSMEKLSSGYRINRAGDDAAGLSISEKMRSQIRGLMRASRNAQDGISMIQTAEGALNEQHSILQKIRELAVQSASDTNQGLDRQALQNELSQLTSEINRIGNTTEFNGMKVLDGSLKSKRIGSEEVVVAKSGTLEFTKASGITKTHDGIKLEGEGFKFDESSSEVNFDQLLESTTGNVIEIKQSGNGFTVDMTLTEATGPDGADAAVSSGVSVTVDAEAMIRNDDGSFTYDSHGVSFSISKEEAERVFATPDDETIKIDLFTAAGAVEDKAFSVSNKSFGVRNDYADGGDKVKVTDFELGDFGEGGKRLDFSKVKIEVDTSGDTTGSSSLVVTFLDENDEQVLKDTITKGTTLGEDSKYFEYESNGVKFNIAKEQLAAAGSMELTVDLDERLGTKEVEFGGTLEDKAAYFHVGANANQTISMEFGDMRAAALGIVGTGEGFATTRNVTDGIGSTYSEYSLDISTREGANFAIQKIDEAINKVSQERSKYGAVQNRLEYTINNLNTSAENMQAAESRIRDVDMASEIMEMTKNNILQQAAQAMLVQANQRPQQALQLLQ